MFRYDILPFLNLRFDDLFILWLDTLYVVFSDWCVTLFLLKSFSLAVTVSQETIQIVRTP